jgi:hypothetical protein
VRPRLRRGERAAGEFVEVSVKRPVVARLERDVLRGIEDPRPVSWMTMPLPGSVVKSALPTTVRVPAIRSKVFTHVWLNGNRVRWIARLDIRRAIA